MILVKKIADLKELIAKNREKGGMVGFAPTMGALHPGHLSLIEVSRNDNSITICSIFVNPAQFNDKKDFEKYPATIEQDLLLLEAAGCNVVFLPSVSEMYPTDFQIPGNFELGEIENVFEGAFRAGHFQGVCRVMYRLLDIVKPDNLYMGQKDYQQTMVIRRLIQIMNLERRTSLVICPTRREHDGLAMSSRNIRLDKSEREKAPLIFMAMNQIKNNLDGKPVESLKIQATKLLNENGFKVDYIGIADQYSLAPVEQWDGSQKIVILVAAYMNEVRLIDNLMV